jgi:regulator of RNase E activity RraA
MSMRSRHLGAVGTIIDGNVRDIAEQQSMEWPVSPRGNFITKYHAD